MILFKSVENRSVYRSRLLWSPLAKIDPSASTLKCGRLAVASVGFEHRPAHGLSCLVFGPVDEVAIEVGLAEFLDTSSVIGVGFLGRREPIGEIGDQGRDLLFQLLRRCCGFRSRDG